MKSTSLSTTEGKQDMKLFYACFIALITTSFGFILRAIMLPVWGREFNLSQIQLGQIAGVGLWPFAISIVLFSLIIDKIGYKTALVFAFIRHVLSAIITVQNQLKKEALKDTVLFPIIMLISYVMLILYFRSKGGYKAILLNSNQ